MDTMHDLDQDRLITQTHDLVISSSPAGNHCQGPAIPSATPLAAAAAAQPCPQIEEQGRSAAPRLSFHDLSEASQLLPEISQRGALFPPTASATVRMLDLPNEVLLHILRFLDVCDLLSASRVCLPACFDSLAPEFWGAYRSLSHFRAVISQINHRLRRLSLAPILHAYRLRHTRAILPPLLSSPSRPSLAELIGRSIFLTNTTVVSRRLARSLVSIRLARRLAARPSAAALVARAVLPPECVPGLTQVHVAPALVAKRRAIEKERVKDGLRRWVGGVWKGEVMQREEGVRRWEESRGVGRVWRLKKYWERIGRGDNIGVR